MYHYSCLRQVYLKLVIRMSCHPESICAPGCRRRASWLVSMYYPNISFYRPRKAIKALRIPDVPAEIRTRYSPSASYNVTSATLCSVHGWKGPRNLAKAVTLLTCVREMPFRISVATLNNLNDVFRGFPQPP
jgi:hypothetical protein